MRPNTNDGNEGGSNFCKSGAELLMPRHSNSTVPTSAMRASNRVLVINPRTALVRGKLARAVCQLTPAFGSSILKSFRPLQRHRRRLLLAVAQDGPIRGPESRVAGDSQVSGKHRKFGATLAMRRGASSVSKSRLLLYIFNCAPGVVCGVGVVEGRRLGCFRWCSFSARRRVGEGWMEC